MPGSLLTPHDALSDRSEASYGSADSRVSAKKVSFNKAVRVKQYPWTPDDNYGPEDGATHLSLPCRRFWFKVYKSKPQQAQNGDHWPEQNGSIHDNHYSQPRSTHSWDNPNSRTEDSYDSLAPIVEDDGLDHDDRNHVHINGLSPADRQQQPFQRNHVKEMLSPYSDDTAAPSGRGNGTNDSYGYLKNGQLSDSSVQTTNKHPVLSGFKAVLAKSQAKLLKGDKKDTSSQNRLQNEKGYIALSPHKQSSTRGLNYFTNVSSEKLTDANDKSGLLIKIPRAESPRRGRDSTEFSMRYKTSQRRSRSSGDTSHKDNKQLMISDKSVSTDDLDSLGYHGKVGLSSLDKGNKDKSTQCNGTLLRSKPATVYGTPRISRSTISNLVKTGETRDKNGNFEVKTDAHVNSDREYLFNGRSTDNHNRRSGRNTCQFQSTTRNIPPDPKSNVNPIITKPRLAMNCYRLQNNKGNNPPPSKESYTARELKSQEGKNSKSGDQSGSFFETKSAGIFERGRGLSVVPEGHSVSRQDWKNTPLTERRASSWERSTRPTPATVGYQRGRYVTVQRLHAGNSTGNNSETSSTAASKTTEKNRLTTGNRDACRSSSLYSSVSIQNREISSAANSTKNSLVSTNADTQDMIDWSLSGFQLGPPTVDRELASDSECFVHQRPPLLMYIPGVSHHEKPAIEEDRMSGLSSASRVTDVDELRPFNGVASSYLFSRRNSMPKESSKSWVKWKIGGKPSRQP